MPANAMPLVGLKGEERECWGGWRVVAAGAAKSSKSVYIVKLAKEMAGGLGGGKELLCGGKGFLRLIYRL